MNNFNFNINDYATKTRKLCDKDYFRWAHDFPFVHLICTNDGILLTGTHDYRPGRDGGLVLRKNQGRILIPDTVKEAYELLSKPQFEVAHLSDNQWFILRSPIKTPVMPLKARKNIKFNPNNAVKVGHAVMRQTSISLMDGINQIPFKKARVTFHLQDCLRVDIQEEIGEIQFSLDDMRGFYGKHLQGFVGDSITFYVDLEKETSIPFSQHFMEKVKIPHGTTLELYRSTDDKGRLMFSIAPMAVPDLITGETVDAKMEMPEPVVICKECNDNIGSVRLIANEFLKLAQTFQEFAEKYDAVSSENEKILEENEILKKKLESAEQKNAAILELLKA